MHFVTPKSVVEFNLHAWREGKPLHAVSLLAAIAFSSSMDWPEPVLVLWESTFPLSPESHCSVYLCWFVHFQLIDICESKIIFAIKNPKENYKISNSDAWELKVAPTVTSQIAGNLNSSAIRSSWCTDCTEWMILMTSASSKCVLSMRDF